AARGAYPITHKRRVYSRAGAAKTQASVISSRSAVEAVGRRLTRTAATVRMAARAAAPVSATTPEAKASPDRGMTAARGQEAGARAVEAVEADIRRQALAFLPTRGMPAATVSRERR